MLSQLDLPTCQENMNLLYKNCIKWISQQNIQFIVKEKLQYKGNKSISGQKGERNVALTTSSSMQLREEDQMYHSKLEEVQTASQQHNPEGERDRMSQKWDIFYFRKGKINFPWINFFLTTADTRCMDTDASCTQKMKKVWQTCNISVPTVTWPWRALILFLSIRNFKT